MNQEFEKGLPGCFWLGVTQQIAFRRWQELNCRELEQLGLTFSLSLTLSLTLSLLSVALVYIVLFELPHGLAALGQFTVYMVALDSNKRK